MGFGNLPPVEKTDKYMDTAFKKARTNARDHTLPERDKSALARARALTLIKVDTVQDYLSGQLGKIMLDCTTQ